MKKALTLTIVANMTSNYSEGIGNIARDVYKRQVQKLGAGKSTNEEFLQELQDAWDNLSK